MVAGGCSRRFGGARAKQYLDLLGRTVVERAVAGLARCPGLDSVVVVVPAEDVRGEQAEALRRLDGVAAVVAGGDTRSRSVRAGVEAASASRFVLVHDAARPLVSTAVVRRVLEATRRHGAAIPGVPIPDTVKRCTTAGTVEETVDRGVLVAAQTPQGARRDWLLDALDRVDRNGGEVTDEASALEIAGHPVRVVDGDPDNFKITVPADLDRARRVLESGSMTMRVGHGFDVHRFADDGRPLVLGGVRFEGERGLLGHSDADVVLHAAMDAALGATSLGDLGSHFPPEDPRWEGASSLDLAARVAAELRRARWRVENLDLTVLAERPRIRDRVAEMRAAVATALDVDVDAVGLKATTLEGLGALGRGEGIACEAVALVRRSNDAR